VMSDRNLLASMTVHMFLQTQLSMEIIKDSVEGRRHENDENKETLQKPYNIKEAEDNWLKYVLKRPGKAKEGKRRKSLADHLAFY
jgi:hypothetical protein